MIFVEALVLTTLTETYKSIRRRDDWDADHVDGKKLIEAFQAAGNQPPPYHLLPGVTKIAEEFFERRKIDRANLDDHFDKIKAACKQLEPFLDLLDIEPVEQGANGFELTKRNINLRVFQAAYFLLDNIRTYSDEAGDSIIPMSNHIFMKQMIGINASFVEDMPVIKPKFK